MSQCHNSKVQGCILLKWYQCTNLDGEIHGGEFYITIQNTVTEKQEIDKVLNVLTSSCVFLETLTSTSLTVLGTLTLIQLDL